MHLNPWRPRPQILSEQKEQKAFYNRGKTLSKNIQNRQNIYIKSRKDKQFCMENDVNNKIKVIS